MKKELSIIFSFLGINPIHFFTNVKSLGWFVRDYRHVKKALAKNNDFAIASLYPCLADKSDKAGTNSGHYFHQDLIVAQQVFLDSPVNHIDIGSRIDGFVAHVASFRKINVIDIRELRSDLKNIEFIQLNICDPLLPEFMEMTDSISCLHAIEHFGLGRYGDPIDLDAHLKALNNFHRMLKINGRLFLSTPIGTQRIEFNAHRVFSISYLLEKFQNLFKVEDFYYVNDQGDLIHPESLDNHKIQNNFGCEFGCGVFFLRKIED